jgi:hypothetical protein
MRQLEKEREREENEEQQQISSRLSLLLMILILNDVDGLAFYMHRRRERAFSSLLSRSSVRI